MIMTGTFSGTRPTLTHDEAYRLALKVRDFWYRRHYIVRTRLLGQKLPNGETIWSVRSDMINGYPQRHPAVVDMGGNLAGVAA